MNIRDIALFEDRVPIYPHDLRKMMRKYLMGEITANELNKWIKFLRLRAEYCSPNETGLLEDDLDSHFDDYLYEDMWEVINRLSTPEIDGEITPERVKEYLAMLDKYGECCYQIMQLPPTNEDIELIEEGKVIIFEKDNNNWFIHFRDKNNHYDKCNIHELQYIQALSNIPIGHLSKRVITKKSHLEVVRKITLYYQAYE